MRDESTPFFVTNISDMKSSQKADIISLGDHLAPHDFSEDHLQSLIHHNPELLPVTAFEPYFLEIIPVCRELPTPAGPLDNLYVTPEGNLILVECKLWRNPESRRKVVAQIMDYAKEIATWRYEDLRDAINRANRTQDENPLYKIAEQNPNTPNEQYFTDQVSRNLRLGRHLLLIVGDGVQEGVERLANFLQQNMGLQYTLGLLEMNLYKNPMQDGFIVIPNIIAKTVLIERGILRIDDSKIQIHNSIPCSPVNKNGSAPNTRSGTISDIEFFETLAIENEQSALWLRNLLPQMELLGINWDIKRSLIPYYSPDGEVDYKFGFFKSNGTFDTRQATWSLEKNPSLQSAAFQYVRDIAAFIPRSEYNEHDASIRVDGKILNIKDIQGHEQEFIHVLQSYLQKINKLHQ